MTDKRIFELSESELKDKIENLLPQVLAEGNPVERGRMENIMRGYALQYKEVTGRWYQIKDVN